jgi:hypothetical protein
VAHAAGGGQEEEEEEVGPTVSAKTTMVSSNVETIDVDEEEDDAKLPSAPKVLPTDTLRKATTMEGQASETRRKVSTTEERSSLGVDILGDAGSQKRARRAPPKPIKPGLRSASK